MEAEKKEKTLAGKLREVLKYHRTNGRTCAELISKFLMQVTPMVNIETGKFSWIPYGYVSGSDWDDEVWCRSPLEGLPPDLVARGEDLLKLTCKIQRIELEEFEIDEELGHGKTAGYDPASDCDYNLVQKCNLFIDLIEQFQKSKLTHHEPPQEASASTGEKEKRGRKGLSARGLMLYREIVAAWWRNVYGPKKMSEKGFVEDWESPVGEKIDLELLRKAKAYQRRHPEKFSSV